MKSLPQWGASVLLVAPFGAWGLGLGDIELQSALNEPFSAEIALTSATAEELESLRVGLANANTFERYGLDRPAELSSLSFRVVRGADGRNVIRVTSPQPIVDPFLTMLVEATWPRGRLLREYTVLLDPPLFSPDLGAEAPIRQASTSAPRQGGAVDRAPQTAAPQPVAAPASRAASSSPTVAGGRYGPVQDAETLWSIASSLRPDDVTINQMMVALYEANPSAFDGNMNLLRRGATLTVPERRQLLATTAAAATAEVGRQETAWAASRGEAVADAAGPADSGAEPEQSQARLRLVPAAAGAVGAETGAGATGTGTASAGDAGGADEAEVARLRSEIESLRGELDESRRLLELRDEQLSELQARLGSAEDAAAEVPAPAAPVDALPAAAPGVDLESEQLFADEEPVAEAPAEPVTEAETVPAAEAEPEPVAVTTPAPSVAPAVTTPAAEPSLLSRVFGWISNPLLLIGLGVGAVLLTAVWYLRNRRDDVDDVTGRWEALEADVEHEEAVRDETVRQRTGVFDEPAPDDAAAATAADDGSSAAATATDLDIDDTLSSQTVINLDQADSLAEADFHMAYGLYDQAADLVMKALEKEPERRDLKLKLLEVYFVWGNKDAFLDAARDLHAELGGQSDRDWDKVLIMGKQICPDEPMFGEAAAAGGDVDVDLQGDGSTTLDFAFEDGKSADLSLDDDGDSEPGSFTETGLDFELAATGEHLGGLSADDDDAADFGTTTAAGEDDAPQYEPSAVLDDTLDIGERTAAGLEAALFTDDDDADEAQPGADAAAESDDVFALDDAFGAGDDADDAETGVDLDALAATQESPTVERPQAQDDWSMLSLDDSATAEQSDDESYSPDAPTMETPTVEAAGPDAPTVESPMPRSSSFDLEDYDVSGEIAGPDAPTVETAGPEAPTVETPTIETEYSGTARLEVPSSDVESVEAASGEHTEEIDLDDLGLDLDDLGALTGTLSGDLVDLSVEDDGSDTREQPALQADDDLLSATGVTEVLSGEDDDLEDMNTEVLGDQDATMLAPGYDEDVLGGTEVLEERRVDTSGDTSLLKMLDGDAAGDTDTAMDALNGTDTAGSTGSGLDLDLEDLASALEGDTVEQPRSSLESDIFAGDGATPLDLDVGMDIAGSDDPTGTEDVGPLDPQTMTEIGTKLDLARAYIDMGDPDGARSILEEVLDEGDSGQRREAQGLIDVLSV